MRSFIAASRGAAAAGLVTSNSASAAITLTKDARKAVSMVAVLIIVDLLFSG
jgi:hypothetical protein